MSQDALARLAGVSKNTVQNAESSKGLHANTVLLLLQALHEHTPVPLEDLHWLGQRAGLSERAVIALHDSVHPPGRGRDAQLHARLDELLEHADPRWVEGLLDALAAVARSRTSRLAGPGVSRGLVDTSAIPPPRSLTVKGPPIERGGHTEHTEVDYEVLEAPTPQARPKPKAQRRPAAG